MKKLRSLMLCLLAGSTHCFLAISAYAAPQVFTPNWAVASALTEMGHPPIAMGDKRIYPLWVRVPVQPESVIDAGARYQPNRELLAQLPMTLVLDNFFYAHLRAVYPPQIPAIDILFDGGNTEPEQHWQSYVDATRNVGDAIGARNEADAYLRCVENELANWGADIRQAAPHIKSYVVVQFADSRQLRIYAANSMFHVAFDLMGLQQSDLGRGDRWGNRQITLKELAQLPDDSCLLVIAPLHRMTEGELAHSYLWQRMGFGKTRCLRKLPAIWLFGGPDSIRHFADALHHAMLEETQHAP
ncbi:MAG: ABC transporter substrate-binding protein [Cardiobacteriaceae bacterium]|nr:ABC transporter substrate-binding protein [Cardiobacteriaceae bacterium]